MTKSKPKRVLIVDDNLEGAGVIKDFLEGEGHQVVTAAEPVAALHTVETFVPDVCILDIELPVMDGYELAARLRDTPAKNCVLVALTGYGLEHDSWRSREAGFKHRLVKPVDLDQLARIVGEESVEGAVVTSQ